ncbi:MAG: hypothetical protein CVV44_18665 [Spirochaetae bacterium HGW-Spirochaetae-1]|jgi:HSP20 family protein|nr:MAG: hypothetical protein CVV44_18665 [Spirochaetae bacterium HGW-Spirochaetae-1]
MFYTYDIFDEAVKLRDIVDRYFRDMPADTNKRMEYPLINLYEKGDTITVRAVVPGVAAGDLSIELANNNLLIQGERKSDYADKPYMRKERDFGSFKKSVRLPFGVKTDSVRASLENGILTVSLEKSDEAKPRRIEIH